MGPGRGCNTGRLVRRGEVVVLRVGSLRLKDKDKGDDGPAKSAEVLNGDCLLSTMASRREDLVVFVVR